MALPIAKTDTINVSFTVKLRWASLMLQWILPRWADA